MSSYVEAVIMIPVLSEVFWASIFTCWTHKFWMVLVCGHHDQWQPSTLWCDSLTTLYTFDITLFEINQRWWLFSKTPWKNSPWINQDSQSSYGVLLPYLDLPTWIGGALHPLRYLFQQRGRKLLDSHFLCQPLWFSFSCQPTIKNGQTPQKCLSSQWYIHLTGSSSIHGRNSFSNNTCLVVLNMWFNGEDLESLALNLLCL